MDVNAMKQKKQLLTKNRAVCEGETAHRHVLGFVLVFERLTSLWNLICTVSSSALPNRGNKPRQGKHSQLCLPGLLPPLPSEQTALSHWRPRCRERDTWE